MSAAATAYIVIAVAAGLLAAAPRIGRGIGRSFDRRCLRNCW